MYQFNLTDLEPVNSDWLRSHLREVIDRVMVHDSRFAIVRRGKQVAGLVPIQEARALWTVAHRTERYREWQLDSKLRDERELRRTVAEEMRKERGM